MIVSSKPFLRSMAGDDAGGALQLDDLGVAAGGLRHRTRPRACPAGRSPRLITVTKSLPGFAATGSTSRSSRKTGMPASAASATTLPSCSVIGAMNMRVRLLRDQALDVLDLLGLIVVGVGHRELVTELLGLVLHAGGLGQPPRVVARVLAEGDLVGRLGLELRRAAGHGHARRGRRVPRVRGRGQRAVRRGGRWCAGAAAAGGRGRGSGIVGASRKPESCHHHAGEHRPGSESHRWTPSRRWVRKPVLRPEHGTVSTGRQHPIQQQKRCWKPVFRASFELRGTHGRSR